MNLLGTPPLVSRKVRLLTVLDVGSTKITCIIARLRPRDRLNYLHGRTHQMEVLGFGVQRSYGVKSGNIVDMASAEQSIRLAVDAAEQQAGLVVDSLIVNFSCGHLRSDIVKGSVKLGSRQVNRANMRSALANASRKAVAMERHVAHFMPLHYSLDNNSNVADPIGMVGDELGVDVHLVTAESAALRNLELCLNRAYLTAEAMVATPLASGLAALVDDETRLGAACIDIGGGTTTFSVFSDGLFVHAGSIPVGGHHVTLDIARGFSTPVAAAERLKVMHGSSLQNDVDDRHMITIAPIAGENAETQYPRGVLNRIIRARVEETLEMVRDRLNRSGYGHVVGKRVVLTGGGSQLTGLAETARQILGRNVRVGRPLGVSGLPAMAKGAAFATSVGLLIYPQSAGFSEKTMEIVRDGGLLSGGHLRRMGQWLKDSF